MHSLFQQKMGGKTKITKAPGDYASERGSCLEQWNLFPFITQSAWKKKITVHIIYVNTVLLMIDGWYLDSLEITMRYYFLFRVSLNVGRVIIQTSMNLEPWVKTNYLWHVLWHSEHYKKTYLWHMGYMFIYMVVDFKKKARICPLFLVFFEVEDFNAFFY